MDNFGNYIIIGEKPIKEAVEILNHVHSKAMTLFVLDEPS